MATKNQTTVKRSSNQESELSRKGTLPSISVKIDRLVGYAGSKVRAIASANIGDGFAIHGLRVMDSEKGLYVSMPSRSYQKNGKIEYSEVFHPLTSEARQELNGAVLEAYEQELAEEQSESLKQNDPERISGPEM